MATSPPRKRRRFRYFPWCFGTGAAAITVNKTIIVRLKNLVFNRVFPPGVTAGYILKSCAPISTAQSGRWQC